MPWVAADVHRHTKAAKTPAQKAKWARVANGVLAKTGDEGKAIRLADYMIRQKPKAAPAK